MTPIPRADTGALGTRGRLGLGAAIAVLVVVPLVPGVIEHGSALGLVRLPVESLVALLVLALIPWRAGRWAVAAVFGTFVVTAIALAAIDSGYRAAVGARFVLIDWPQLSDAYGVLVDSIGEFAASAVLTAIVVILVGTGAALAWAAMRTDAALRRRPRRGRTALATVTAAWIVAALVAVPVGGAGKVAAAASADSIGSAAARTEATLRAQAELARRISDDDFADVPPSRLLTSLRGKDVLLVFVESYGKAALHGTAVSRGVVEVLREGETALARDGYEMRSAWLTSPTFGGVSWLAHATLQSGLWIDTQADYAEVLRSERLTLSGAFQQAGWRTVGVVPSNIRAWDEGREFYGFDALYDTRNLGYRGPKFGYARVPDQYTLKRFADRELAGEHPPVMAEIDLVSSHSPWAPLPSLVEWGELERDAIFDRQIGASKTAAEVWENPATVRRFYADSIEYSLGSLFSFFEHVDDPDLVVIVLGDHQPNAIVSGEDADHDVPVHVIAKDPAVLEAIAAWGWDAGLHPDATAPVWRMDEFRDRFFEAFSAAGPR